MNPLIIFDLTGAYAMFRKFYTNSSSLSYPFPPRSAIAGLIAGLMGYERDTYMEDLGIERCDIAVSVRGQVRRVMQTVNYVMTERNVWAKNTGGFDGSAGGIQIPIGWVFPAVGNSSLCYRIYISHSDPNWLEQLATALEESSWIYPPYLGMSECLGEVNHVATLDTWNLEQRDDYVSIATVLPSNAIEGSPQLREGAQIVKERTPFALDSSRRLVSIGDVLYDRKIGPITVRVNRPVFEAEYVDVSGQELREYGVFLR